VDKRVDRITEVKSELTFYLLETEYSCDISARITGSLSAATMLTVLVGSSSAECRSHWPSTPVSRSSFTEYWKLRSAACRTNDNVTFHQSHGLSHCTVSYFTANSSMAHQTK